MEKEIYKIGKEIFNYLKDNFKVYTVEECKQLKDKGAFGVIYITQCKVNNKLYIGQKKIDTKDFTTYLGSGKIFKQAVDKYGKENFERIILEVAYSKEELNDFEIKYIELFGASEKYNRDLFYNIALGGECGGLKGEDNPLYKGFVAIFPNGQISKTMTRDEMISYLGVSEIIITELAREKTCYIGKYERIRYIRILHLEDYLEEREIIYKSDEDFKNMCKRMVEEAKILYEIKKEEESKRKSESHKGIYPSEETRKKISEANTGREVSEETRKKLSEAREGKYAGENSPNYGKHPSEETRKKLSEAREGKKAGEETKKKISEALSGENNPRAKLVVCIFPNGRVIKDICIKKLAKELGINEDTARSILRSKQPYKPRNKRLKYLEGIIIMYQEDYLNTIENQSINDDKAS